MKNSCSIICNTCGKIKRHLLPEQRNCPNCGRVKQHLVKPGENPPEGICTNNKWYPRRQKPLSKTMVQIVYDRYRYKDALQEIADMDMGDVVFNLRWREMQNIAIEALRDKKDDEEEKT